MTLTESANHLEVSGAQGEETVLVVDDSPTVTHVLSRTLATEFGYRVLVAEDYAGCDRILEQQRGVISVAVADLNLPDATRGEVVQLILSANIPVIVLTGAIDAYMQAVMYGKDVVDYVLKLDRRSVEYGAALVNRIVLNQYTKVLVADPSSANRKYLSQLLKRMLLQTFEAETGDEALNIIARHSDIKLLLAASQLPHVNGQRLIRCVREHYSKDRMSIIALADQNNQQSTINMLKSGANDFIRRPFVEEEFCVRVHANLEVLDLFQQIQDKASRDMLTGLYNRDYWYETAPALLAKFQQEGQHAAIAIVDIDHCKRLNDEHGQGAVDIALVEVAKLLRAALPPTALLARMRGDEFCALLNCQDAAEVNQLFERFCHTVAEHWIEVPTQRFQLTLSVGLTLDAAGNLSASMTRADRNLRLAKERGANRVVYQPA